ncbi:MAG TPA: hypothetical protein VJ951_04130, partial [Bacteroidales bacterium]|nr:hypothetical protein [Bacteroidales bacterium]
MRQTVFYNTHLSMGGKMVPFAGYEMPVEFSGVKNEHNNVRNHVGVFDVSHMGEIKVTGPDAAKFVQHVTSNDVQQLVPGKIQYSCFPNGRGGIVDDLLVYMFSENHYLLVVNASNIEKDYDWLVGHQMDGAEVINESYLVSQLAVQGPDAGKVIQKITDTQLSEVPYFHFVEGNIGPVESVLISNTGYTGAGGFELYMSNADGPKVFNAVMDAGKEFNIAPAGLAA